LRFIDPAQPHLIEIPKLGSEEIEQQPIVRAAIDGVALPLPADKAEAETFYGPDRRVMGHSPGIDRVKAKIV